MDLSDLEMLSKGSQVLVDSESLANSIKAILKQADYTEKGDMIRHAITEGILKETHLTRTGD
jgi:hypothetical protein